MLIGFAIAFSINRLQSQIVPGVKTNPIAHLNDWDVASRFIKRWLNLRQKYAEGKGCGSQTFVEASARGILTANKRQLWQKNPGEIALAFPGKQKNSKRPTRLGLGSYW
jgi:hypothetical protein